MERRISKQYRNDLAYQYETDKESWVRGKEEQTPLDLLLTLSEDVRTVHILLHAFLSMARERKHEQLCPWMEQARQSGIPELKSFVSGVERDYDAVKEALRLPWSRIHRRKSEQAQRSNASCTSKRVFGSCVSGSYMMLDLWDDLSRRRPCHVFSSGSPKTRKIRFHRRS